MNEQQEDYVTLKWGTLKSWRITSEEGMLMIEKYFELGNSASAIMVKDTQEQKELICQLIDTVPGDIYLEWEGEYVSKQDAKNYIMQYGKKKEQPA